MSDLNHESDKREFDQIFSDVQSRAASGGALSADGNFVHQSNAMAAEICEHLSLPYKWPDARFRWLAAKVQSACFNVREAGQKALAAHDQANGGTQVLNLKELPNKSDEERAEDFMDCNYDSHTDCVKWLAANFADVRRIAMSEFDRLKAQKDAIVAREFAAHDQKVREQAFEEAAQVCENESRCYADSHRCHDNFCHDQDAAAIRAQRRG